MPEKGDETRLSANFDGFSERKEKEEWGEYDHEG